MEHSDSIFQVLRESFPRANPTTRQCVVEYISDNQLVDSSNITSLLQTYSVTKHQNILLLCVQYIMSSITRNLHHVMWEELTAEVVKDILAEIDAGTWYWRVYTILQKEFLLRMRFLLEHFL